MVSWAAMAGRHAMCCQLSTTTGQLHRDSPHPSSYNRPPTHLPTHAPVRVHTRTRAHTRTHTHSHTHTPAKSLATSPIRRMFSSLSLAVKPRLLLSPCRTLSPSSSTVTRPRSASAFSSVHATVLLPLPLRPGGREEGRGGGRVRTKCEDACAYEEQTSGRQAACTGRGVSGAGQHHTPRPQTSHL